MENLRQYFSRTDTPSAGSPVGILVSRLVEKFPQMSFEDARARAHEMLLIAAKAKSFRIPAVRSEEQEAARKAQFAAFTAKRISSVEVATQQFTP